MMDLTRKLLAAAGYLLYLSMVIALFDVVILHNLLGYGYPRHYEEENIERYPAPYVAFTGKPDVNDHNELGFRGPSFAKARPEDLKIAFFGGSTGYQGDPPIPEIFENELEELLGASVFVANFSVVSSNHRQHLHGIIEYLPAYKPDLVIFYGGYNETIQSASYDPRPGYPYNFFYRSETGPLFKLLLESSAFFGELDMKTGLLTGIKRLREAQQPLSDQWNKKISEKYLETLMLAKKLTGTLDSTSFGKTRYFAFYQPYQVPEQFIATHSMIKKNIAMTTYAFDVSSEYDALGDQIYSDIVHVKQEAREIMGKRIAAITAEELRPDAIHP